MSENQRKDNRKGWTMGGIRKVEDETLNALKDGEIVCEEGFFFLASRNRKKGNALEGQKRAEAGLPCRLRREILQSNQNTTMATEKPSV